VHGYSSRGVSLELDLARVHARPYLEGADNLFPD
jgi:hypothetical protein